MSSLIIKNLSSRIFVKIILLFIFGIFSFEQFGVNTTKYITIFFFLCFLAIMIVLFKHKSFIYTLTLIVYLISFMSGAFYINYRNSNDQIELKSMVGEKLWVYGIVVSSPQLTEKGNHYSVDVEIYNCEKINKVIPVTGKMKVYVKKWQNKYPKINDSVYFYTELNNAENFNDDFDYVRYLKTKNICITGFTNTLYLDTSPSYSLDFNAKIKYWGRKINLSLSDKIDSLFSYDNDANSLVKGILLGNKDDFSENLAQQFSKTGISHITAVSGLHLNIIITTIISFLTVLRIRKKYASIVIIPLLLLFSAIVGFTPSVCRAAIMLIIMMFGFITKRQYDSMTALFVSAFILLLYNPYLLFSVSFILSFSATLSIILLYKPINNFLSKLFGNKFNFISSSVSVSVSAFVGTASFVAYYFDIISFVSLIANIWVIPLCSCVLTGGYIYIFLSSVLDINLLKLIFYPLIACIELIIKTSEILSNIYILSIPVKISSAYSIFIYFLCIYFVVNLFRKRPNLK